INDSVLMWSHYADNHTGLVLEFDTNEPPFSQIPKDCWLTVKYSDKKADYVYSRRDRDFLKEMFAVAAAKASDWSYEKEIRIVVADTAIRNGRFLPLTPKSITAVYCGCRCSTASMVAVRAVVKQQKLSHVICRQAILSRSQYALEFVPL